MMECFMQTDSYNKMWLSFAVATKSVIDVFQVYVCKRHTCIQTDVVLCMKTFLQKYFFLCNHSVRTKN